MNKIKFAHISRTIDSRTGIHYLDGVDEDGIHWMAEMRTDVEPWITYSVFWRKDPQPPSLRRSN